MNEVGYSLDTSKNALYFIFEYPTPETRSEVALHRNRSIWNKVT